MSRSNSEKKRYKNCPYYDTCPLRMHPLSAMDNPNMAAHLGFRFLYTLIAWFVLGNNVTEGFFVSMLFFVLPVFMDCLKFTPLKKFRRLIKMAEVTATGFLLFISVLGVLDIYVVINESGEWKITPSKFVTELPSGIGLEWIWGLLGLIVFVTLIDWLCNDAKIDRVIKPLTGG